MPRRNAPIAGRVGPSSVPRIESRAAARRSRVSPAWPTSTPRTTRGPRRGLQPMKLGTQCATEVGTPRRTAQYDGSGRTTRLAALPTSLPKPFLALSEMCKDPQVRAPRNALERR
jgi:hypothetical protein